MHGAGRSGRRIRKNAGKQRREKPQQLQAGGQAVTNLATAVSPAAFVERWQAIAQEAKLTKVQTNVLWQQLMRIHEYMALREAGKHYLLLGYELMRLAILEVGRRSGLGTTCPDDSRPGTTRAVDGCRAHGFTARALAMHRRITSEET